MYIIHLTVCGFHNIKWNPSWQAIINLRKLKKPISQQKCDIELHFAICLKEHQSISWLDEAKTL